MLVDQTDLFEHTAKPILKWAGGKRQLLPELKKRMPARFNTYHEPFVGGGALFFAMRPQHAVLSDSNAELINLYEVVANDLETLALDLKKHENTADYFYELRARDWLDMKKVEAASRTLYLNRTCFNGLYRVNKKGQFNVPFGKYKNPVFRDLEALATAANLLKKATLLSGDFKQVLQQHTASGDFVFLDPPYVPVSEYSDFKRYTKEQFGEQEHIDLAQEVDRLKELGCHVLLTNSDCEVVHDLYGKHQIDVVSAKRNINSKADKRVGRDVIVTAEPDRFHAVAGKAESAPAIVADQLSKFPPTRFMGSKRKLLPAISAAAECLGCESVLDLFSGSGVVSYMLKTEGKQVTSNDYMALSATLSKALIENNETRLPETVIGELREPNKSSDNFVQENYSGLYFSDIDNELIDTIRANIKSLDNQYHRAIALSALIRACFKKRPRGIFTYVGDRYDDGRKDLKLSLSEHFEQAVHAINGAVFNNGEANLSSRQDALQADHVADLVYIDPPYFSEHSDNAYVRRYHFVEGIACDWHGVEMQWNTKTKKFKNYPSPFSTRKGTYEAFDALFEKHRDQKLLVSYSSNSKPTLEEMVGLLEKYKSTVEVQSLDHRYSFGNQAHKVKDNKNSAQEYLFLAS